MRISVLISTYISENPSYLNQAIKSIWTDQTRKPNEIVLVEDGPLTKELYDIIENWQKVIPDVLRIVKKEQNGGLASALNSGIQIVTGDLIARMDSDDISLPQRFELQEQYLMQHPEVDILGGSLCEFNDKGTLHNIRHYPLTMPEVINTMYRVSPLAHPTVMFRKRFFDEGFSYSNKYYICEDITLWYDAAVANKIINNIPDVILKFRRNDSMMTRRSRKKAFSEFHAYNNGIYRLYGFFTYKYFFSVIRLLFRLLPTKVITCIYNGKIRKIITKDKLL